MACCEESGPDRTWPDELTREEALALAEQIVAAGVPYVAFGGGEPLGVPHCWDLFERLAAGGVALKIETDGCYIDDAAADRLVQLPAQCVQISLDGALAATHERARPGASHAAALAAIERLALRGRPPQWVFVPNRFNIAEVTRAYDRACELGCEAFVTGPMMRIGRAAQGWSQLACSDADWLHATASLRARSLVGSARTRLSIYPWDILEEMQRRLEQPQAMLLIVPNGRVKLLNALPFTVSDLREESISAAWDAYRAGWRRAEVAQFVRACRTQPELLLHANATWALD